MNKTLIIVAVIIGLSLIGYGAIQYLTVQSSINRKAQIEVQKEEDARLKYSNCLTLMGEAQVKMWDSTCASMGLPSNCSLPKSNFDRIKEETERGRKFCSDTFL